MRNLHWKEHSGLQIHMKQHAEMEEKCRCPQVIKLTNVLKVQEEAKFPGLKQFKGKVMEVKVENNGLFSMWLRSRSQVLCFSGQELFSLWPGKVI